MKCRTETKALIKQGLFFAVYEVAGGKRTLLRGALLLWMFTIHQWLVGADHVTL